MSALINICSPWYRESKSPVANCRLLSDTVLDTYKTIQRQHESQGLEYRCVYVNAKG